MTNTIESYLFHLSLVEHCESVLTHKFVEFLIKKTQNSTIIHSRNAKCLTCGSKHNFRHSLMATLWTVTFATMSAVILQRKNHHETYCNWLTRSTNEHFAAKANWDMLGMSCVKVTFEKLFLRKTTLWNRPEINHRNWSKQQN